VPFSRTWTGIVLGLIVGAVAGFLLLKGRLDYQFFADENHHGHGGDELAIFEGNQDPIGDRVLQAAELFNDRTNAIVLATRKVAPAVVSISVVQQQASQNPLILEYQRRGILPPMHFTRRVHNMGSGVIVSDNGMIVTNNHVIEAALQIIVTLSDGRQFQAIVLDRIPRYDLAILRIQARDLPVARIASDAVGKLQVGDDAMMFIRPEALNISDKKAKSNTRIKAVVTHSEFEGQSYHVFIEGTEGKEMKMSLINRGEDRMYDRGKELFLSYDPNQAVALPAGELASE